METIENKYSEEEVKNFKAFRKHIKDMAEKQRFLKNQRKTEKLQGERKMSPTDATYEHQVNREKLRVCYAALGVLKGKKYSEIENHYPDENHPLNQYERSIERVLKEFKFLNEED